MLDKTRILYDNHASTLLVYKWKNWEYFVIVSKVLHFEKQYAIMTESTKLVY